VIGATDQDSIATSAAIEEHPDGGSPLAAAD